MSKASTATATYLIATGDGDAETFEVETTKNLIKFFSVIDLCHPQQPLTEVDKMRVLGLRRGESIVVSGLTIRRAS